MASRSLFARVSGLSELHNFRAAGSEARTATHAAVSGLIGASRSLLAGALGRLRVRGGKHPRPSVVLLVVDGPEAALDAIADLRSFVALEEKLQSEGAEKKPRDARQKTIARLAREEQWADAGLPASETVPDDLRKGLFLESTLFPAWDVLPTESDRPEG